MYESQPNPIAVVVQGGAQVQHVAVPGGPTILVVRPQSVWPWIIVVLIGLFVLLAVGAGVATMMVAGDDPAEAGLDAVPTAVDRTEGVRERRTAFDDPKQRVVDDRR